MPGALDANLALQPPEQPAAVIRVVLVAHSIPLICPPNPLLALQARVDLPAGPRCPWAVCQGSKASYEEPLLLAKTKDLLPGSGLTGALWRGPNSRSTVGRSIGRRGIDQKGGRAAV